MIKSFTAVAAILFATSANAGDTATLLSKIQNTDRLSTFSQILENMDIAEDLSRKGAYTIFAPTDAAFAALDDSTMDLLMLPENAAELAALVLYHIDDRKLTSHSLAPGAHYYRPILTATQADARLCITNADSITLGDSTDDLATVTDADIKASNGVLHVIDKVLVPGDIPACNGMNG